MFPLIYLSLVFLYFYVVILVVPSVKRGVGPSPPPLPWSATFSSRKNTLRAVLWEWVKYFIELLISTPKLVSQHIESAQPPEHITHKITNEELERIVEQAGERANQSRGGKIFSPERDISPPRRRRGFSPCKERRPASAENGSGVVSFPPDAIVLSDGEESKTEMTETDVEQSDNQMMEGNVGTKNESRSRPGLKLPYPIFEDCESDYYAKKAQRKGATKLQLAQKYNRQSEKYGTLKRSTMYRSDHNFVGPELVIYRGELMSPRRKTKESETRRPTRSMSCPPRLMEQTKAHYSPADTLEAIQNVLAVPLLARESFVRKKCSSNNLFDLTDHFPNKTTMWGEVMPIDLNALNKVVPESNDELTSHSEPSKLWVVLDVDECLIHSTCTVGAGKRYRQMEARPGMVSQVNTVFVDMDDGEAILVNQRPGLMRFLEAVADKFNVVAFTAGKEYYTSRVLDAIDPNNRLFTKRLFRQHCHAAKGGIFVKDLRCVEGLDLSRAVLVDNSPLSFIFQPNNGILVSSWFDDAEDAALNSVLQLLHYLTSEDDVRPVLRDLFGLGTILKSYRTYIGNNSLGNLNDLESWEGWPDTDSVQEQGNSRGTEASNSTLGIFDDLGNSGHYTFGTDSLNLSCFNSSEAC